MQTRPALSRSRWPITTGENARRAARTSARAIVLPRPLGGRRSAGASPTGGTGSSRCLAPGGGAAPALSRGSRSASASASSCSSRPMGSPPCGRRSARWLCAPAPAFALRATWPRCAALIGLAAVFAGFCGRRHPRPERRGSGSAAHRRSRRSPASSRRSRTGEGGKRLLLRVADIQGIAEADAAAPRAGLGAERRGALRRASSSARRPACCRRRSPPGPAATISPATPITAVSARSAP